MTRKRIALVFLAALHALALAAVVRGDDDPVARITVKPDGPVAPGTWVTLDASTSIGDTLLWDTETDLSLYRQDTNGKLIYFAALPPGSYVFRLDSFAIKDQKIAASRAKVAIVVQAPVPPRPPPQPAPVEPVAPAPAPVPIVTPGYSGPLNAVLVWDSTNDEPSTTSLRVSTLGVALTSQQASWFALTKSQVGSQYDRLVRGDPTASPPLPPARLPAVFFLDHSGKWYGSLPVVEGTTPATVQAKIQSIRGGTIATPEGSY